MLQIRLVTDEHNGHVGVAVRQRFVQPPAEVVERLPAGDVVNEQCARRVAVVAAGDGAEGLLARRVPYLGCVWGEGLACKVRGKCGGGCGGVCA